VFPPEIDDGATGAGNTVSGRPPRAARRPRRPSRPREPSDDGLDSREGRDGRGAAGKGRSLDEKQQETVVLGEPHVAALPEIDDKRARTRLQRRTGGRARGRDGPRRGRRSRARREAVARLNASNRVDSGAPRVAVRPEIDDGAVPPRRTRGRCARARLLAPSGTRAHATPTSRASRSVS